MSLLLEVLIDTKVKLRELWRVAVWVGLLLAVAGCAPSHSYKPMWEMTPEQQTAINSVSIAPSVSVAKFPIVFGPSTNSGALVLGPLGALGATSEDNPDGQALKKMLAEHGIDLGKIVREEFVKALKLSGSFPRVDVEQGDATFELSIDSYGLGQAGLNLSSPINGPMRPHMRISAKLTSRNGELQFMQTDFLSSMGAETIDGRLFNEILADPKQTEEDFRKIAGLVSRMLLKDLPLGHSKKK